MHAIVRKVNGFGQLDEFYVGDGTKNQMAKIHRWQGLVGLS